MASKIEYQDLEVKGTVKANEFTDGILKNSGFEVVTELPTTELFEGRQVFYQNRVWVYSNGWLSPNNPVSFPKGVSLGSSREELNAAARYVASDTLEQIPDLLNKALLISNNDNCVKNNDRLYELIDNETGLVTVQSNIVQPDVGQTLRYTAINPSYDIEELYNRTYLNNSTIYTIYCVEIIQNKRIANAIYKVEYYVYTNATGDGDINNRDNYEWKTVFEKALKQEGRLRIYPVAGLVYGKFYQPYTYLYNIRVSITPTTQQIPYGTAIKYIDIKYYGQVHQPLIYANRLINYDAVIEPTQAGETFKSIPWILQYLTQGVNWLRAKLSNGSMSLNGTTVNLGDNVVLPWYVDFNEVDYPARIRDHWLQIYRNGVWANLVYLGDILPTQVGQITSLDNLDWYNEQLSEYEVDSNTTISILVGTTLPAAVLFNCPAEQLTLNLYPINGKKYVKGSLDSLISDLQGKGFSVFVENDLDAIIGSGSDYLIRIKVSKVPTPKAIIECYVAR